MANIKSAIKRIRTAERDRLRNSAVRSKMRTEVRKAEAALSSPDALPEAIRTAQSAIDRAAKAGAIHPRQAARRKSRLMHRLAQSAGEAVQPTATPAVKPKAATKPATPKAATPKRAATPRKKPAA